MNSDRALGSPPSKKSREMDSDISDYEQTDDYEQEEMDESFNMASDDDDAATEQADRDKLVSENQFLTQTDLEFEMENLTQEVHGILEVSPGICRILLQKYQWNNNRLMDRFYESGDTKKFLIESCCLPKTFGATSSEGDCDICCDTGELISLGCGHMACAECWKAYLTEKIKDGHWEIECLAPNCKLVMEEDKIMSYLKDPAIVATYHRVIVNNYVATNSLLKWCPGADCGKAVKVTHMDPQLVVCPCGTRFCFSCCEDFHEPISCRLLKLWFKRCMDDSETSNWLSANTKDCPKCNVAIEKNGGCNHMRCTNKNCQFYFCWNCMKSLTNHQSCNRFESGDEQLTKNQARARLEKYLFYYNRYMGHQKSLELEEKLKAIVAFKMDELQNFLMSWVEVQFLKEAVEVLRDCRRTLMYTYAFAFYLKKDNNSEMFETNQNDLEQATEEISGLLERDLEDNDLYTLKHNVQNKCRYVAHRRKILLDHCTEGYEQDTWKFTE